MFEAVYIAEYTWNEAMYVLDRKVEGWVRGSRLAQDIADDVLRGTRAVFASLCTVIPEATYAIYQREARLRIPGDPDDWHTVAVAMATATAIWTLDQKHFFGCGMAIWNTKVLRAVLTAGERRSED